MKNCFREFPQREMRDKVEIMKIKVGRLLTFSLETTKLLAQIFEPQPFK